MIKAPCVKCKRKRWTRNEHELCLNCRRRGKLLAHRAPRFKRTRSVKVEVAPSSKKKKGK